MLKENQNQHLNKMYTEKHNKLMDSSFRTLQQHHQNALSMLELKLTETHKKSSEMSRQLEKACKEIDDSQRSYSIVLEKLDQWKRKCQVMEKLALEEREIWEKSRMELEGLLRKEREVSDPFAI
jgi:uncharacterized protein with gpF-like domain